MTIMQQRNGAVIRRTAAFCLAALIFAPAMAHGQRSAAHVVSVAADSGRAPVDGLTQAIEDTIAGRLAALEVQRAELVGTGRTPEHPDLVEVDRQLAALRAQLSELPNAKSAQAAVNVHVLHAIEARLAGLAVDHRLRGLVLPANHPALQAIVATEAVLQRRRSELQALIRESGRSGG